MYLSELIDEIYENNSEIENLAAAHNLGDTSALNELPAEIIAMVQETIREEYGNTIELYHGSETAEPDSEMIWNENTSFTDEFDIEFAGEDGYIVIAQIPADRIKFYLNEENEFVITAGKLDCTVETVAEYFGL